jgi:hypothetical protein
MLRPTLANLAIVTIMAMVGIYLTKGITRTVNIPGLSDLANGI